MVCIDSYKHVCNPILLLFLSNFTETEDFGLVKSLKDLEIRNEGYAKYGFNALASRNIGIYREVPDTRHNL